MSEWIQALLRDVSIVTLALATVAWLLRTTIIAGLARDIEKFKASLQLQAEQSRHEYQLHALEHQVRFADLHARRARLICKFHISLQDAFAKCQAFVNPLQYGNEQQTKRGQEAGEAIRQLFLLERQLRIFLPKDLSSMAQEGIRSLDSEWFRAFSAYSDAMEEGANPYVSSDYRESFGQASKRFAELLPSLLDRLEQEFRWLIGVESRATTVNDGDCPCAARP